MSNLIDLIVFVAALACLSIGCGRIYAPLAMIVPSAVVLILVCAVRFRRNQKQ